MEKTPRTDAKLQEWDMQDWSIGHKYRELLGWARGLELELLNLSREAKPSEVAFSSSFPPLPPRPTKTWTVVELTALPERPRGGRELGDSRISNTLPDGWVEWIEWGKMIAAPVVAGDRKHDYEPGTGTCRCGCGCYMGGSSSSGPVDPFGPCPGPKEGR